jgi:thioesterase domain-containing protein
MVVELQAGNGGLPLFAVAAPGVRSLGFGLLVRHLGSQQPVYKLQGREPRVVDRPYTSNELRSIARQYIAAMRAVQPQGPYILAGMCAGVQISEQMILDLEAEGLQVGLFAIFDTWVMEHVHRPWRWRLFNYQQRLREIKAMSAADKLRTLRRVVANRVSKVLGKSKPPAPWPQAYWPENFTPPRFHAPVALFKRPKQPYYYIDDPQMGWGSRSYGGVEIHEIDFEHGRILREPYVQMLAARLADCIQRTNRQSEHPVDGEPAANPATVASSY